MKAQEDLCHTYPRANAADGMLRHRGVRCPRSLTWAEPVGWKEVLLRNQLRTLTRRHLRRTAASGSPELAARLDGLREAQAAVTRAAAALLDDPAFGLAANAELGSAVARFLGWWGDAAAAPVLVRTLCDRTADFFVRWEAAQAYGRLESRRDLSKVQAIIQDPSEDLEVRKGVVHGLWWNRYRPIDEQLVALVADPSAPPSLRGTAAETLSVHFDRAATPPEVVQALRFALGDADPEVRFWAIFALGTVGTDEDIPALERVVATDEAVLPEWWSLRREAEDAIAAIRMREQER